MIEVYHEYPKKYVVTNKDRIVLVTYLLKCAEALDKELSKGDYPKDFCLQVSNPKLNK
jgi:hypothetical protein